VEPLAALFRAQRHAQVQRESFYQEPLQLPPFSVVSSYLVSLLPFFTFSFSSLNLSASHGSKLFMEVWPHGCRWDTLKKSHVKVKTLKRRVTVDTRSCFWIHCVARAAVLSVEVWRAHLSTLAFRTGATV